MPNPDWWLNIKNDCAAVSRINIQLLGDLQPSDEGNLASIFQKDKSYLIKLEMYYQRIFARIKGYSTGEYCRGLEGLANPLILEFIESLKKMDPNYEIIQEFQDKGSDEKNAMYLYYLAKNEIVLEKADLLKLLQEDADYLERDEACWTTIHRLQNDGPFWSSTSETLLQSEISKFLTAYEELLESKGSDRLDVFCLQRKHFIEMFRMITFSEAEKFLTNYRDESLSASSLKLEPEKCKSIFALKKNFRREIAEKISDIVTAAKNEEQYAWDQMTGIW